MYHATLPFKYVISYTYIYIETQVNVFIHFSASSFLVYGKVIIRILLANCKYILFRIE